MLSKLVTWLLSPLGIGLCLAGLALLLAWRLRLRSSMTLGALAFVWLWAWSMPVLSHWLGSAPVSCGQVAAGAGQWRQRP
jgi:hypothetical protein